MRSLYSLSVVCVGFLRIFFIFHFCFGGKWASVLFQVGWHRLRSLSAQYIPLVLCHNLACEGMGRRSRPVVGHIVLVRGSMG